MPYRIFISYRREDEKYQAARIRDHLAKKYGAKNVYMDVDMLYPGQRFDKQLEAIVKKCDAVIVVMGPKWGELLQRRLRDGGVDYVQHELAIALKRRIAIVPVLIDEARMPPPEQLPPEIKELPLWQAIRLRHDTFARDFKFLKRELWWILIRQNASLAGLTFVLPLGSLSLGGMISYFWTITEHLTGSLPPTSFLSVFGQRALYVGLVAYVPLLILSLVARRRGAPRSR